MMQFVRFRFAPGVRHRLAGLGLAVAAFLSFAACAAEKGGALRRPARTDATRPPAATNSIEALTAEARESIVVVTQFGRDQKEEGVGAGFVISDDGLIGTSLHVIGEGRPIRVRLASGKSVEATEVFASDRKLDLAIIRVDAGRLRPLRLGDSDKLKQGAPVVAIGNPLGLEHSVVQGVLSARREFEGIEMLQLAIPIEPGNSGGPLLDLQGRVHGVLTLKSAMTPNLGFAMPVNLLKALMERPNPVPMSRWISMGALNPREWTTVFGGVWKRRGGNIAVEGAGKGFGGRSLCLARAPVPERPFEIVVEVKLEDERGAAGLVFGSDGAERHYGFYPSAGQLRLTRFDGPDVFSWNVLRQIPSPHYRKGAWNRLRVRVDEETVRCFVNDEMICEGPANDFPGTSVGLAKFRDTRAEFKGFQVSTNSLAFSPELQRRLPADLAKRLAEIDTTPSQDLMDSLRPHAEAARHELSNKAEQLERQAVELRKIASRLHRQDLQAQISGALDKPEAEVDLFRTALLIAKHDYPDLDVAAYQRQLAELARELAECVPAGADDEAKLSALRDFLFTQNGFHGSRTDYYNRANSYINRVLDDREGLPITLSIVFLELARAIGLQNVSSAPLPGHFMVQYSPGKGPVKLIDVFDGGRIISRSEAQERIMEATGSGFRDEHLKPASKRDIIVRMLRNLQSIAERSGDAADALHYADVLVAVSLEPTERLSRVRLRLERGDGKGAQEDLKWILDAQPAGVDLERLTELYESLKEREGR
jgi:regulator of sirC expression with transglutaminase-like and TPR domain